MKSSFKKYFFMTLKIAVAALLLYWVGKDLDYASIRKLSPEGLCFGFFLSLILIIVQTALSAVRWKMLLHSLGIRIHFFRALSLTFQGSMFSLLLPGGSVGGDVLKAAFLTRECDKKKAVEGVTTIFLDRLIGMMGLFSLALILCLCSLPIIGNFPAKTRYMVYLLALCCLGCVSAGVVILFQKYIFRIRLFALLLQKADSFTKGAFSRILNSVESCRQDSATLWKTFLLSLLVIHPLLLGCAMLIFFGISGDLANSIPSVPLAGALGNVASVIPVSPGGLGTRDKVTEIILAACNINSEKSALLPLIYSCANVCSALLGGLIFFLADTFGKLRTTAPEDTAEKK